MSSDNNKEKFSILKNKKLAPLYVLIYIGGMSLFIFRDDLSIELVNFFSRYGIKPVYGVTVILLLLALYYQKDIQNWDKLRTFEKFLVISTIIMAIVSLIFSVLSFLGVGNL